MTEPIVTTENKERDGKVIALVTLALVLGVALYFIIETELQARKVLKKAQEKLADVEEKTPANHTDNNRTTSDDSTEISSETL